MYKSIAISTMLLTATVTALPVRANVVETVRSAQDNAPRLQALSINANGDIWVSGVLGKVLVSRDDGQSWQTKSIAGSEQLQFRDIWARESTIYLLAAGEGSNSRIYQSVDDGATWQLQYTMENPKGFINCFDFWDQQHGLVIGDSIDNKVFILQTNNGGKDWTRLNSAPEVNRGGEGAFSASGSCLRTLNNDQAWLSTGATEQPRLLRTSDRGATWATTPLPFPNTNTGGIFTSLPQNNLVFGGQMKPEKAVGYYRDNQHWRAINNIPLTGAIYGSASIGEQVIIVNPDGAALSKDGGKTWKRISNDAYWVVEIKDNGDAWLAGPAGRISRLRLMP